MTYKLSLAKLDIYMKIINVHQAKTQLSKLLKEVAMGKKIIIGKAGVPVAELTSFPSSAKKRTGGQLKGKIVIFPDFDKLPNEFMEHFTK